MKKSVATLALGSRPRQGLTKVRAKSESGSHISCFGNARECEGMNPTLPSEFPLWELESQWTLKFSKGDCKGQNSLDLGVFYIIEKLLEFRCLKWACMTHLGT
jgi:hypothetical protein